MRTKSAVIGLLLIGFALLAAAVTAAATEPVDHAVLLALHREGSEPVGPLWLERAVVNLSALGSTAVVVLIAGLAGLFLLFDRRPRQALLLGITMGVAVATVWLLKGLFARPRPSIVEPLYVASGLAFPSGHALLSAVLYPTLGILIASNLRERAPKVFVFAAAAVLALLVGVTRVYLGVHYPSDVLGGWLIGLAFAFAAGLLVQRLEQAHLVERPPGGTAGDAVGPIP